jgi:poly-gamma-glutamate synthesis protein (capsule biosynthesis protein)
MRFAKVLLSISLLIMLSPQLQSQEENSVTLLFTGDIMGHDTQINAAWDSLSGEYYYDNCFQFVKPIFEKADFTICNLEVTLAGPPFKGYPQFSSPDALAVALKNAGVDVLATANNHSCDRRKQGVERTIHVLDSLKIPHTGTFLNQEDYRKNHPLFLEKNNIRIALLNYTYGTNGIPTQKPNIVNRIDTNQIRKDIARAKEAQPDHIIVFMHWGLEYKHHPNKKQITLAQFCKDQGADIVIGSHPHVLQKMEWDKAGDSSVVVYSLGNFVSNQRTFPRDGGAMFEITFSKNNGKSIVQDAGYYLTWVYPPKIRGDKEFFILPIKDFEEKPNFFLSKGYYNKMIKFADSSRLLLNTYNLNINEIK